MSLISGKIRVILSRAGKGKTRICNDKLLWLKFREICVKCPETPCKTVEICVKKLVKNKRKFLGQWIISGYSSKWA